MPISALRKTTTELFGDRLRELSDTRGSYSQIARDLGINRQQFARYLNGTSRPRDALVRKMAQYFDVDESVFFQSQKVFEIPPMAPRVTNSGTAAAIMAQLSELSIEKITQEDLRDGLYMQYNHSFTQPEKVSCLLVKIYRDEDGIVRSRRKHATSMKRFLPGLQTTLVSNGVFAKNLGSLVQVEVTGIGGYMMVSSFKHASLYTVADRVLTGVTMNHGRTGGYGPTAALNILERIPDNESKLDWGRRQGFVDYETLPDYIQYFLRTADDRVQPIMQVR